MQIVKQNAPFYQRYEADDVVVGVLNAGMLVDVIETKMDSKGAT